MSSSGFWLGQTAHGGAINLGNANEYLYFRGDTGLRLKTTDLEIGAGGAASFSGGISTSDGRFAVARSGDYDSGSGYSVVCGISSTGSTVGLSVSTTFGLAAYFSSTYAGAIKAVAHPTNTGDWGTISAVSHASGSALRGVANTGIGAYLHGRTGLHVQAVADPIYHDAAGIEIVSEAGSAHMRMGPIKSGGVQGYIPHGKSGDLASIEFSSGDSYLVYCYKSTTDGKGKWRSMSMSATVRNGGDRFQ